MDWKARISALVLWLALVLASIEDGNAEQRIVCYYTNWSVYRPGTAKFSPQNINPYLCTHLIYAFGGFTKDNTLKPFDKYQDIEKGGYAKFTGLKTYNKNLKTMLAIGGWNEGSSRFSPMVADPGRRKEFVKNSVKFLRQNHFDGLDLDWEYPAFRDGGKPRDRNNYADLVQELREEFERESSKTGRPRLLLSMAVPAGIEYIDKGYDIPRLNDYLDFINLLSYDYHSAYEPAVNHHSPLYPLEEDNEYNYDTELTIDYTIQHLLKSGASSEKIVLGIPTYGRSYTLINEDATDLGSPADGPGEEGDATREKGYLAYYEICESIAKSDEWEVVQPNPNAMGPYAFREKQWVGYDDEDIVRAKARYVNEKKLGGIMFWSIDNDDFRGKCHGRPYPLIEAAKEAMLAGNERVSTRQKTKISDSRKKTRLQAGQRIQGNTIGRKLSTGNRRTTTTQAPTQRRRVSSSRSNARSNARSNVRGKNNAEDDEEEDEEEEANVVKAVEKPRTRIRSQSKNRRRNQSQNSRNTEEADSTNEASLSFTTPEPPTTPDPGSDFKCEDEGFFSHPRDCKKYFWCLDSGPGGLGVVAHQFTCPSGLVFNKAADSCDYPRNVVCPKKTSQSTVTTTKAPTTTKSSRINLKKPSKRTTTPKPEVEEEEYEYYDDEEVEDSEEAIEEPSTTTSRPLQYKTINRSRPTTTTTAPTTTTTEATIAASTRSYKTTTDRLASFEDEEDPRVLKELIDLIKKAGGIEQLEKQLHFQEKNSGGSGDKTESNGKSTPATISRSLYERVLSRQATRIAGSFGSLTTTQSPNGNRAEQKSTKNSRTGFVNGPGGAQFEGLDNVPEVKSLRRTNKPKYVTIERHRPSTSESPAEKDDDDEEDAEEDNADVASSEDRAVSNPPQDRNTNRRVTPNYVNIRRPRPSTTTSENDVEVKDEDSINEEPEEEEEEEEEDEEPVTQRHRIVKTEESSGPKSRYTNVNRFRSTTSRNNEIDQLDDVPDKTEITTESTTTTTTSTTTEKVMEETSETSASSTTLEPSSTEFSSTLIDQSSTSVESSTESSSIPLTTDSPLKLVEESATEILFTTVAASSSSPGSSTEPFTRGPSVAAVSQPRPFGFPRRGRPTGSTSSVTSVTEQSRPKVDSETLRLPTLKELIGYSTVVTDSIADLTSSLAPPTKTFNNITIDNNPLKNEQIDRNVTKNQLQNLIHDLLNEDNVATEENNAREVSTSTDKEILDNDVLGSEEVQQRSYSSSFVTSTKEILGNNDTDQSFKRIEVPVRILDDIDDEEIAQLVLLRLPESKLNSPALKPIFRVKILEQDHQVQRNDVKRNGVESSSVSSEDSLENELSEYPTRPSRRRRVRINASPSSATSTSESDDKIGKSSRPRNRQDIVNGSRRSRVTEAPLDQSSEGVFDNQENERSERVQGVKRIFGLRNNVDDELETSTLAYPAETPTTIKVTTSRGKRPTSSKPSNVIHGFYITKSSDEIVTPITDATTADPLIDSTKYPSTTSDELTQSTDFVTENQETFVTQVAKINTTTDENSILDSTTISEVENKTRIGNNIDSFEDLLRTTSDKFETVTADYGSTIEDKIAEMFEATIMTSSEEPLITTFRPFTTNGPMSNPTISMDSTIDYSTGRTEDIDKYTVTNQEETTGYVPETLKTSENSYYGSSTTGDIKSSTVPMTTGDNNLRVMTRTEVPIGITIQSENPMDITTETEKPMDITTQTEKSMDLTTQTEKPVDVTTQTEKSMDITTQTEKSMDITTQTEKSMDLTTQTEKPMDITTQTKIPIRITTETTIPVTKTTDPIDKTTTHTINPSKRGRVRFTAISKSAESATISARDQQRKPTKISDDNDTRSESVSGSEFRRRSSTSTEVTVEKVESTTSGDIGSRLYTSRSSSRSRNRHRNTVTSNGADNSKSYSIVSRKVTPSVSKVENSASTEANIFTTNFGEATFSRDFHRGRKTTQSFDVDDVRFNSVTPIGFTSRSDASTEVYEKTVEPTISTTDINDLTTNFMKTTENIFTSKILDTDDVKINSVTPSEFTSTNYITTAVYKKTPEPDFTNTEAIDMSTHFVETTTSSSKLFTDIDDYSQRSTKLFEIDDTTMNSITQSESRTDKNSENMTTEGEVEESTERILSTSKSFETDDSTTSTTPIDIISTNAITVESYDTTINENSITENLNDSNLSEINGKSFTSSLSEIGTTEMNEKLTDSLETTRTADFITSQETINPTESTNSKNIITTSEATTIPWVQNRGENLTEIANDNQTKTSATIIPWTQNRGENLTEIENDNQTETVNMLNQVTLMTSQDVTTMNTFEPTTEVSVTTDFSSNVKSAIGEVQINKEKENSTEAVKKMDEAVTTSGMNMKIIEQSISTIPIPITTDHILENIGTTKTSAIKSSQTINNRDLNLSKTTIRNNDITLISTKINSITTSSPRETKRTRGRIRFTNFAAHNDEVGRQRRPVKQVVVRRRLANPSNNHPQINVSTEETIDAEDKIGESEIPRKQSDERLPEEIRNSTKWMRRRVVKIGNSAESRTNNKQLTEENENVPKSINRHAVKIVDSNEDKINIDQSQIDEEKKSDKITEESSSEGKKTIKWMRRRLVKIGNSSEEKTNIDRPEINDQVNKNNVVFDSSNERMKNSGKWARRRVVKIGNQYEDKINSSNQEIEKNENVQKMADDKLAEDSRNSTKSMRRRVVVYRGRPRAESITTTTMQSTSVTSDEIVQDIGKTRRRKWRKRLVAKRAKSDEPDDQNIAETGHFHHAVIDDFVDEDMGALGSRINEPMVHQLVNYAERDDDVIDDGEVNIYKSSGNFLRRPGTLIRPEGANRSRLSSGTLLATTQTSGSLAPFSKIRPAPEYIKSEDQSGKAQELAVTLADPPEIRATSTTGRLPFRKTTRKISTTIAPRTEAPTTSRTTISRRRQRPKVNNEQIFETVTTRPRRPAIIDYDYYVDDEIRLVVKPELKDKLFVTRKGGIRCLDQGNFAHPTSCKKFITCARMVNGQVLGTEYTCPDKLSFDPVGGICNWSAGLGCEDKSNTRD